MSESERNNVDSESEARTDGIRLYIPPRYLILTSTTALTGLSLGLMRGGRQASMQYLAENAHRQPRTVEGWYFYKKTKNYRVMWGALKGGGREAMRLGSVGLVWAGLEDGFGRLGGRLGGAAGEWVERGKEVCAGVATGSLVAGMYRLPRALGARAVGLGGAIGLVMGGLREVRRVYGTRELSVD